jgi:hypothetical protein
VSASIADCQLPIGRFIGRLTIVALGHSDRAIELSVDPAMAAGAPAPVARVTRKSGNRIPNPQSSIPQSNAQCSDRPSPDESPDWQFGNRQWIGAG